MMRYLFSSLAFISLLSINALNAAEKPNIVFVMADDLGWADTSSGLVNLGNPSDFFETPFIDQLAQEGMVFTNAYTSGANCAPTRAALLTGQYAQRPTNNIYQVGSLNRGTNKNKPLLFGPKQGNADGYDAIPNRAYTYAEHLQENAGYFTAHLGKFHVTERQEEGAKAILQHHGFVENWGGNTHGHPKAYHANEGEFRQNIGPELDKFANQYTQEYVDKNIKPFNNGATDEAINGLVGTEKNVTDAMVDAAIDIMERKKAEPFLLQYHPYAVHTPVNEPQARKDLLHKYKQKPAGKVDHHASFGAITECLDQSVARLVNYLKTTDDPRNPGKKLSQNTIVIFYSDNGGKLPHSNNGPLKGQKGELDEGGIRVPLIIWSENKDLVAGGTVNETPVVTIDFYKTYSAWAGVDLPTEVTLDGIDISPIVKDANAKLDRDAIYWHLPGYLASNGRDQRPQSVLRSGKWKLLYNYENLEYELYDLDKDIGEKKNLADSHPAEVKRLGTMLLQHLADTNAPLAKLRNTTLSLDFTGTLYRNGKIESHDGLLKLDIGEEVPLLVYE